MNCVEKKWVENSAQKKVKDFFFDSKNAKLFTKFREHKTNNETFVITVLLNGQVVNEVKTTLAYQFKEDEVPEMFFGLPAYCWNEFKKTVKKLYGVDAHISYSTVKFIV